MEEYTGIAIAVAIVISSIALAVGAYETMRAVYAHNTCISSVMVAPEGRVNDVRSFCGLKERPLVKEEEG